MRVVLILVAQLAISIFVTATVMPMILVSVPAAREHPPACNCGGLAPFEIAP